MFFSTLRNAIRDRKQAEADRDFWKDRALSLEKKLEQRSDFFVEREFRLVDRFLTSQVKTFAITDEIRNKENEVTDIDVENAAMDAFLTEKKDFLVQCAREAGLPDPEDEAARTFEANRQSYLLEFKQGF